MKLQIASIGELAKSSNSKLLVIPSDITRTLGSLAVLLEGLRAK
jgi:hypothetical protein